jgi:hypothetical protein
MEISSLKIGQSLKVLEKKKIEVITSYLHGSINLLNFTRKGAIDRFSQNQVRHILGQHIDYYVCSEAFPKFPRSPFAFLISQVNVDRFPQNCKALLIMQQFDGLHIP